MVTSKSTAAEPSKSTPAEVVTSPDTLNALGVAVVVAVVALPVTAPVNVASVPSEPLFKTTVPSVALISPMTLPVISPEADMVVNEPAAAIALPITTLSIVPPLISMPDTGVVPANKASVAVQLSFSFCPQLSLSDPMVGSSKL